MKILVSNDDGYFAPGITLLAEALSQVGEVTVVAPERDRSGASNSLTLDRPLTVRRAPNGFFSVNGTPTDCVHIAVTGLLAGADVAAVLDREPPAGVRYLLPDVTLSRGVFLDGSAPADLPRPVEIIGTGGDALVEALGSFTCPPAGISQ